MSKGVGSWRTSRPSSPRERRPRSSLLTTTISNPRSALGCYRRSKRERRASSAASPSTASSLRTSYWRDVKLELAEPARGRPNQRSVWVGTRASARLQRALEHAVVRVDPDEAVLRDLAPRPHADGLAGDREHPAGRDVGRDVQRPPVAA